MLTTWESTLNGRSGLSLDFWLLLVVLCVGLVAASYETLTALEKLSGIRAAEWIDMRWKSWTSSVMATLSRTFRKTNKGWVTYWPLLICVVTITPLVFAILHAPQYPTYEFYDVSVLSHPQPNSWWMEKADGKFYYTGCPDFPNDRVIWAGYVAHKIRFEERGNCKSIYRPDLGFWWERDKDGNVKEIDYARTARQVD